MVDIPLLLELSLVAGDDDRRNCSRTDTRGGEDNELEASGDGGKLR